MTSGRSRKLLQESVLELRRPRTLRHLPKRMAVHMAFALVPSRAALPNLAEQLAAHAFFTRGLSRHYALRRG